MASEMNDDKIAQFMAITGSTRDTAQSFLQLTQNDLEEAMTTFYETQGSEPTQDEQVADAGPAAAPPSVPDNYTGPRTLSGEPVAAGSSFGASARQAQGSRPSGSRGGISTFRDLNSASAPGPKDADSDEEDDDDEMNYFAGGEKSALSVENPEARKRKNQPGGDLVKEILKRAAEEGQRPPEAAGGSRPALPSLAFTGQGRTINDAGPAESTSSTRSMPGRFGNDDDDEQDDDGEVAVRNLTFWEDGFSIEDGPLMRYDDPANAQTLAAINSGHAPLSLLNVRFGQQVQVRVHRHTDQKYKPPPAKPFAGSGNRLGSPAPSSSTAVKAPSTGNAAATSANRDFEIDSSKPTTQLQIRLGDGQRMTGRFNTTHTVADVRNYINASNPGMSTRSYVLNSSFPPKPLMDESQTLQDAGLLNSVVIQKFQ